MKAFACPKFVGLVTAAVISGLGSAAWSDEIVHYGRAGGAVGADRIQELRTVQRSYQAPQPQTQNVSPEWYGRAGGPVGADLVVHGSDQSGVGTADPVMRPKVYGRAGVPLPFGE